jgi:hypothetical protein
MVGIRGDRVFLTEYKKKALLGLFFDDYRGYRITS